MLVMQNQLVAFEAEVRFEVRVLGRGQIVIDVVVEREPQHHLIDIELLAGPQIKQILLVGPVT